MSKKTPILTQPSSPVGGSRKSEALEQWVYEMLFSTPMRVLVEKRQNNYNFRVTMVRNVWRGCVCVLLALGLGVSSARAQTKLIRLRNKVLVTNPIEGRAGSMQAGAASSDSSALFLIQFKDTFQDSWVEPLRSLQVELLRSVPDDAFIARVHDAQVSSVRSLPFIHWVGEYRSEYRIHSAVLAALEKLPDSESVAVGVLVAADASPTELLKVRRSMRNAVGQAQSRFGTVLRGRIDRPALSFLAGSSSVLWIEPAITPKLHDEIATKAVAGGSVDGSNEGHASNTQQLGFDGRGIRVAVADSGLSFGTAAQVHPDLTNRVDAFRFYGSLTDAADQHSHGTHIAGIIAGDGATGEVDERGALYGLGIAPQAHIIVQRIFNGVGGYEEPPSLETLTRDAVRAGAMIGSNSWGDDTQGRYDLSAMEFDALVRDADAEEPGDQPYVVVFAAGNAGPGLQTISTPAVAKNVMAVGASQNDRMGFSLYTEGVESMADFSSRGPCEDGRVKPDLVAPGTWIASLRSAAAGDQNSWRSISPNYIYLGGTSQAGAEVAGAAAVFAQYYRQTHTNASPSPALVKAALINSAIDMNDDDGTGPVPNNQEGWGRLNLAGIFGSRRRFEFIDQSTLLSSGKTFEKRVLVASSSQPLRVTLTYTDVPGLPMAIPALVNDLDLEVTSPDGRVYRGNYLNAGESVEGATVTDAVNNVEVIHIGKPMPGEYIVRVHAARVTEDSRRDTPEIDQDFALVISSDLPLPGAGVMVLDRGAYTAPGLIQIRLIDFDLTNRASATVRVNSSSEPAGEVVLMRPLGSLGVFTGKVDTAIGGASSDGKLQIKHGDKVTAFYQDASPVGERTATLFADLRPPVLSGITSTNRFGRTVISWRSDEPGTSVVWYGTNRNLSLAKSSSVMTTDHAVSLDNLRGGISYFFMIMSSDEAGNTGTNDNRGGLYTFANRSAATVLLVNAYQSNNFSEEIPLRSYTDALDQTGVDYDVWDVRRAGSPTAADLRPYQIVVWRISDSIFDNTSLTLPQQTAIQEYLNDGGSFFMASMEILSRLGDVPFRTNVLHIQKFESSPLQFGRCDQCDQDSGVAAVLGSEFDPMTSGIRLNLDYSNYPAIRELGWGPDFGDVFTPSVNAIPILVNAANLKTVGLRYPRVGDDMPGRVVFLSFPLDAVPLDGPPPNNRGNLLRNIFSFLAPGVNSLGTIALDRSTYTVPGKVTVEVADSDLVATGEGVVRLYSDSATNGQPVRLTKTVRPGLFRGSITLVGATNAPSLGQLPAQRGDVLRAEYWDESAKGIVRAVAVVDTVAPVISRVVIMPEYETAIVRWETSKAADGLVQFGESTFLGRTSYQAELAERHELRLIGLQPDRAYFGQIVSRDAAGNVALDDNRGRLFSFRTLKPMPATWADDAESNGSSDWAVIEGNGSLASWKKGKPANGRETAARSASNAWGSNLGGSALNMGDTRLVSPAVQLGGGSRATLRFWQSYDFSQRSALDIAEWGRVSISVNNGADWVQLAQYSKVSVGWEKAEIDLTPYLGRVVRLSWHYVLQSLDTVARPGWLIDDVALSVTDPSFGTIQVTNNLVQASFAVTGPVTQTGVGQDVTLANLPPGDYRIRFDDVPYYRTPAPQTHSLVGGGRIVFQGDYTFPDVNNNGMSDLWEVRFFGEISPTRTRTVDTDRDGLSDLSEFYCGTDPANRNSKIQLSGITPRPDGTVRLTWRSIVGRGYRVLISANALHWNPISDWVRATGVEMSQIVPGFSGRTPNFYRLEVHP